MFKFNKRRLKKNNTLPELSMTPMIDTALTLLIIFMVTTPMMQNSIKVDLPEGKSKEVEEVKHELVVNIDEKENIFLNKNNIKDLKDLSEAIKNIIGRNKDQIVFVEADKNIHYGKLVEVVDSIKYISGLKNVVLATKNSS